MKTAEQWRGAIQDSLGDHNSLADEARVLEVAVRAIQADALRHAADLAFAHRGRARKERRERGHRLGAMSAEAALEVQAEERGEDIAAGLIADSLRNEAAQLHSPASSRQNFPSDS